MTTKKTVHKFTKGQILQLDQIYNIQGLANGSWWEKTGNDVREFDNVDLGDEVIITKNITITISVEVQG